MHAKGVGPACLILGALCLTATSRAADPAPAQEAEPEVRVDVNVTLKQAKVVFNMHHLAFSGDTPIGLRHMGLMLERFKRTGTQGSLVAVFHGDAGYMLLKDAAYNTVRKTKTGNPYKEMIQQLVGEGVAVEECALTMKNNRWGNADLLPGVKVNSGANGRIVELVQQGYVMLQP